MDNSAILTDTSILIEYLRKKNKEKTVLYQIYQRYDEIYISAVTEFEVFAGINPHNEQATLEIFGGLTVLPLNSAVARRASQAYQQLKSQNQLLDIRDLFIGATALVHTLLLATLNREHFERFEDIRLLPLP